jgi:ribosome-associated translation inhibitor RaiA
MPGFRTGTRSDEVDILVRGSITTEDVAYVQRTVRAAPAWSSAVTHPRVKLAVYRGPDRPFAVVQANLRYDGRLVRVQETGASVTDAVDRVAAVLPGRVRRLARHLSGHAAGPPSFDGEPWTRRPPRVIPPVPTLARLVRHKAFPAAVQHPDMAALTMDLRDYDVHLFTDDTTGAGAVLYRQGPTGYRVAAAGVAPAGTATVLASDTSLPDLTIPAAVRTLTTGDAPFLPFAAVATGRCAVVYQRYDGGLGLVTTLW